MDAHTAPSLQSERSGGRLKLTLNRPRQRNALDDSLIGGLADAFAAVASDPEIRVVTITGSGPAFCAGADLKHVVGRGHDATLAFIDRARSVFAAIRECRCPVIAAVNGMTLAGGLELALSCDIVVAAEDAMIGDGHANFGMFPGAGGAAILPARIGYHAAAYLLCTGKLLPAARWCELGLVQETAPLPELPALVTDLEAAIESKSAPGLAAMKRVARYGSAEAVARALAAERHAFAAHVRCEDFTEGLAAFGEGRAPVFRAAAA